MTTSVLYVFYRTTGVGDYMLLRVLRWELFVTRNVELFCDGTRFWNRDSDGTITACIGGLYLCIS